MPTPEPLISLTKAREILGQLKGVKRLSYPAFVRLVRHEGLPVVTNPFTGGWAFKESQLHSWFTERTQARQLRGPGRPRKGMVNKQQTGEA